jgi:glycosyltransferase involved in cell wall biosynthesis
MDPIKILWVSDSPTFFTGFATVTKEILKRLTRLGNYRIACLGWGYDGWPYDRGEIPFDIYPSRSLLSKDDLLKALEDFRPDILVSLGDIWMVEWITGIENRDKFKYLACVLIDGRPLHPQWGDFFRSVDAPVTCSLFAQQLVRETFPDVDVKMIYHGVDLSVFRPLGKDEYARPPALKDKFIVGCVARNQPRKNLPILIKAFAQFCKDKKDAVLYLHTNPEDIGWDVIDLLKRHDVFNKTCVSKNAAVQKGISKQKLNEIYNLFDIMALPTAGEGFGLPILESMAAGTPVIATGYSACVELLEGRGELIKVKEFVTLGRYNIEYAVADIADLTDKLNLLYTRRDLRQQYSELGLAFARTFDWQLIAEQWHHLLMEYVKPTPSS